MYKSLPYFVLGFHGCDRDVAEKILSSSSEHLKLSKNDYDWLGNGIYFWENNPERALQYALQLKKYPARGKAKIKNEAVVGAIIDLGNCFNLFETQSLLTLKASFNILLNAVSPYKKVKQWEEQNRNGYRSDMSNRLSIQKKRYGALN